MCTSQKTCLFSITETTAWYCQQNSRCSFWASQNHII